MIFFNFSLFWKKFLNCIILLFLVSVFYNSAYAAPEINVITQGPSFCVNGAIVQNIILSFKTDSAWKLSVLSLDNSLKNLNQPTRQIPINNVFITDNSLSETYYFEPNKTIQFDSEQNSGIFNNKYALRITSADASYAGVYSGTFKFTLTSGSEAATYIYNFTFDKPEVKKITILPESLYIKVLPYDAMKKGYSFSTNSPTKILIQSNTNWKLILKNETQENSLNCKFKVTSLSGKSKIGYGFEYTDLPQKSLIIAEGEPTVSSDGKALDTEVIHVDYFFKTLEDEVQPSDNYSFNVNYNLMSE